MMPDRTRAEIVANRPTADASSAPKRRGRKKAIRLAEASIRNRPARYPPHGAWPAELRADITAAYLDYPNTRALAASIVEGDAPRATGVRGEGATRELTWSLEELKAFLARRHGGAALTRPGARLIDVIPRASRRVAGPDELGT